MRIVKYAALLIAFVMLFSFTVKRPGNDLYWLELSGRVRSATEFTKETERDIKAGLRNKIFFSFDNNGNETEMSLYCRDSVLMQTTTFKYDHQGNRVSEEIHQNYHGKDSLAQYLSFERKKQGKVCMVIMHWPHAKPWPENVMKYDEEGYLIESNLQKKDGSVISVRKYKHKDDGKKIELTEYRKDSLTLRINYAYNEANCLNEETEYDGAGKLVSKKTYQYKYDSIGNWIRRETFDEEGNPKVTTRTIEYY